MNELQNDDLQENHESFTDIRNNSEPSIVPSVLFDAETAKTVDWKAYYPF